MSCCGSASRPNHVQAGTVPIAAIPTDGVSEGDDSAREEVLLGGGTFQMGDHFNESYSEDREAPVHGVMLDSFMIDAIAVTNGQFARFVQTTGYSTESERYGSSAVFHLQVQALLADIFGPVPAAPWWLRVRGADWVHPAGPLSSCEEIPDHPVVHVS